MGVRKINEDDIVLGHIALETYLKKMLKYGLEPRPVPTCNTDEMIEAAYNECGGVLLMGGADFFPDTYGAEKHEMTTPLYKRRDEVELRLVRQCIKDKKPILGICRGCQAINIACGGTLHQHIPEIASEETHMPNPPAYTPLIEGRSSHPAIVEKGSRLFKIIGKERISVTTAHHQAVEKSGANLQVSARSPQGIVEAVEYTDPSIFCFGLQSHPEAEENGDLEPIFKAFTEAVENYK